MTSRRRYVLAGVIVLLALGAELVAQGPERVSVLVQLAPGTDRGPVRAFAAGQGGRIHFEYKILPNVINLRNVPVTALNGLRNVPGVVRVAQDPVLRANLQDSTPLVRGLQSQIQGAGLTANGEGIRICVPDTGIDSNHYMFQDWPDTTKTRIDYAAARNFINLGEFPEDDNGHGAHVTGIAAGREGLFFNGEPLQGIAPKATIIPVKVLNSAGQGQGSDLIAAFEHCVAVGADVVNVSLGYGPFSDQTTCDAEEVVQAANAAVEAGVVVVAAAGNDGSAEGLAAPACGSQVISVGATWDYTGLDYLYCGFFVPVQVDQVICFSNRSSMLDVVAPGCRIHSAAADLLFDAPNAVTEMCGTSQATPHVTGLAALLLDRNPSLTPAQVREKIRQGAVDKGPSGFDPAYGYGRIDVINSLNLAPGNSPPTASIVNPAEGAEVSATVTLQIHATDAEDGAGSLSVEWNVDGGAWMPAAWNASTSHYEASWDTTAVSDGPHVLNARATDSAGQTASDSNNVTVDNGSGNPVAGVAGLVTGRYEGKGKNKSFRATSSFTRGDQVIFRATVKDASGQAVAGATVTLHITGPETATVTTGPSNSEGVAEGSWQTKAPNKRGVGGTTPGGYNATTAGVSASGYTWDGVPTHANFTIQ